MLHFLFLSSSCVQWDNVQLAEDVEFFCADSCRGCIFFLLLLLSCSWLVQLKTIFMLNVLFSIAEELVQHWYVWCLKYFVTNKLWGFFVTRHYSTQLLHIYFVHLWALEFQKESVSLKHIISLWGWTIQDCQELASKGLQHLKKHFWHITAHSITCLTKSWVLTSLLSFCSSVRAPDCSKVTHQMVQHAFAGSICSRWNNKIS